MGINFVQNAFEKSAFEPHLDTLNSKKNFTPPPTSGGPSVLPKYTVHVCAAMPQNTLCTAL